MKTEYQRNRTNYLVIEEIKNSNFALRRHLDLLYLHSRKSEQNYSNNRSH